MTTSHDDQASGGAGASSGDEGMSAALRAMVGELQREAPPELPWDAMERRLLDRIARGEGGRYRPDHASAGLRRVATFAAAAAGLALFVSAGGSHVDPKKEPGPAARLVDARSLARAPGASSDRDLAALRPGDAVESGSAPITFARPGDARFTLAPESRAVIVAESAAPARTVVALERGAIRAEVVPRDPAEGITEAFVVEAGRTRIAVRGTAFSVARSEDSIDVDVEHGTVAVGPAGRAGVLVTTALVGPARASFSLDGVRLSTVPASARLVFESAAEPAPAPSEPVALAPAPAPPEPEAPPRPPSAQPPPSDVNPSDISPPVAAQPSAPAAPSEPDPGPPAAPPQSAPAPAETSPPPAPPPPAPAAPPAFLTPASIKAGVERCFNEIYSSRQTQVKLSIASTMRIQVRADGTVQSASFSPPLAPNFQICAGSAIAGRFKSGPQTITIPVTFGR